MHLGLGPPDYLPPELLAQLQQPWAPDLGASYAPGWHVDAGSWGAELRHNGSDGFWSARFVLIPARGYGILMASNIFSLNAELGPKRIELLKEWVPTATNIGLLVNPANPISEVLTRDAQAASRVAGAPRAPSGP